MQIRWMCRRGLWRKCGKTGRICRLYRPVIERNGRHTYGAGVAVRVDGWRWLNRQISNIGRVGRRQFVRLGWINVARILSRWWIWCYPFLAPYPIMAAFPHLGFPIDKLCNKDASEEKRVTRAAHGKAHIVHSTNVSRE